MYNECKNCRERTQECHATCVKYLYSLCKTMKLNGVDMKIICVAASLLKALCVPFMTRIIFTMPIMAIV